MRINITTYDEDTQETGLLGWFYPEKAERFDQGTEWNGQNMVGVISRSEFIDEYLYRTAGGRWVLNRDAHRCNNGGDAYRFVSDAVAQDWLIRSQINDEAVEKYFGAQPEERGPGRPEVGPVVQVRFPDDLLAKVDERAKVHGVSRAMMIRRMVAYRVADECAKDCDAWHATATCPRSPRRGHVVGVRQERQVLGSQDQ